MTSHGAGQAQLVLPDLVAIAVQVHNNMTLLHLED